MGISLQNLYIALKLSPASFPQKGFSAMKKYLQPVLCLVLLISTLAAQDKTQKPATSTGLPPLIDREVLFGNPEIAAAQISPNGKYLAFLKPWKDTRNVYVKGVDEPFGAARLLTTESKRPVAGYFWSRDSKYILYIKDNDGDENFNVYAVEPQAKPAAGSDAPPSRDMTGVKGARVMIVDIPKNDPDAIYIGLNDRDKAWHDLYKLKLSPARRRWCARTRKRFPAGLLIFRGNCGWL